MNALGGMAFPGISRAREASDAFRNTSKNFQKGFKVFPGVSGKLPAVFGGFRGFQGCSRRFQSDLSVSGGFRLIKWLSEGLRDFQEIFRVVFRRVSRLFKAFQEVSGTFMGPLGKRDFHIV